MTARQTFRLSTCNVRTCRPVARHAPARTDRMRLKAAKLRNSSGHGEIGAGVAIVAGATDVVPSLLRVTGSHVAGIQSAIYNGATCC